MPKKSFDKTATLFSTRIHDEKTLSLINELADKLGNRNAVINDALKLGVPTLYARVFGKDVGTEKEKREHAPSMGRELKEMRKDFDELFATFSVVETLVAGLYNAKIAEHSGEDGIAERLSDGSICALPELAAEMKADLMRHRSE